MKRTAWIASAACLSLTATDASAQQELVNVKASNQTLSATWQRDADTYTLQIVLDRRKSPGRSNAPADASTAAAPPAPAVRTPPTLSECQSTSATNDPNVTTEEWHDRHCFFVGRTIANLRGVDVWLACGRTLTLIDRSRPPPARKPGGKEQRLEAWLLKGDGTVITPSGYSCDDPGVLPLNDPARNNPGVTIRYAFPEVDGAQATAVAIRIDSDYYIEKLQPPAGPQ